MNELQVVPLLGFIDNWQVLLPVGLAILALFFPGLAPLAEAIKKMLGTDKPNTNNPLFPWLPPTPNPTPAPDPAPTPTPAPGGMDFVQVIVALTTILRWFKANNNEAGVQAIREARSSIFEEGNIDEA